MTQFDATARINLDISSFTRALRQGSAPAEAFQASIAQLDTALRGVARVDKQTSAELQRSLSLYRQLASTVNTFVSAIEKLSRFSVNVQGATEGFNRVLRTLRGSLADVQGLSEREAERLQRTVNLYKELASTVSQYARALETITRITQRSTETQQRANRETERAARAQEQAARQAARAQEQAAQAAARAQEQAARQAARAQENAARQAARAQETLSSEASRAQVRAAQQAAAEQIRAAFRAAQGQIQNAQRAGTEQVRAAQRAASDQIAAAQRAANDQIRAAQRTAQEQERASAAVRRAAERGVREYSRQTNLATQANSNLSNSLFSLRSALSDVQQVYQQLNNTLIQIPAATLQTAISFEQAFAQIERVTQETGAQLVDIRQGFQQLSEEIPIAFEELAQVGVRAAQIGVAREELLKFTEAVVRFSRTTDVADEQATLLAGRIQQMARVDSGQIENLLSAISELGSSSAATENEILKVTESIAAVVTQTGLSTQVLIGMAGALASLGIRAELSRGALTRVFNSVTQAIEATDEKTAALSRTLGLNQSAMRELIQEEPDEFYLRFFQALNEVDKAGGNLNTTLRSLGIVNSRDINVVTRLASNYELLAGQVDLATDSFARGDFLRRESEKIFDTTASQLTRLNNAFRNFLDSAGAPLLGFVERIAGAANAVIDFVRAIPGSEVIAPVTVGIAAAAAAFVAWRIALAATASGLIAMRQVSEQLQVRSVGLRTVIELLTRSQGRLAGATTAATAAMRGQATAAGAATTANAAAATSTGLLGRAGIAVRSGFARAATFLTGPWGLAIGAATLGIGAVIDRSREADAQLRAVGAAAVESTGGIEAFTDALRQDTEEGLNNERVYRRYVTTREDVRDADRDAADQLIRDTEARIRQIELINGGRSALERLAEGNDAAAEAAQKNLDQIERLEQVITDTNEAIDEQVTLLGDNAAEQARAATEAALLEAGLLDLANATDLARDAGVDFNEILDTFLEDPEQAFDDLQTSMTDVGTIIAELNQEFQDAGDNNPFSDTRTQEEIQQQIVEFNTLLTALRGVNDVFGEYETTANNNIKVTKNTNDLLGQSADAFNSQGVEVESATEDLSVFESVMADSQQATQAMTQTLETLGSATDAWSVLVDEANERASDSWSETLGQVEEFFGSSEKAFERYREQLEETVRAQLNFSTNILTISQALGADVAEQISALGAEAPAVAQLIVDNLETAGIESRERLANELRNAGPEVREAMSTAVQSISEAADLAGESGAEVAQRLTSALHDSAEAALAPGGDADLGFVLTNIQELAQRVAESPIAAEVVVDPENANLTIQELIEEVDRVTLENEIGPEGVAQLAEEDFIKRVQGLEARISTGNEVGEFDPRGEAAIAVQDALTSSRNLSEFVRSESEQRKFDPFGEARLRLDRFFRNIFGAEKRADKAGDNIEEDLDTTPDVNFGGWFSDLGLLETSSVTTGNRIQANLTRTATVTVNTVTGNRGQRNIAFADGGFVTGPGGPRQDKVPAFLSSGEFVVNARSARIFGTLLESINQVGLRSGSLARRTISPALAALSPRIPQRRTPSIIPPEAIRRASSLRPPSRERIRLEITNNFPRSEPTSRTINRALANVALLDGV